MNKKIWLDILFYDIGKQQFDFRLNGLKKTPEGEVISTKWKKYSELCFPLNPWEENKIQYINNREILPIEVVIDLETPEGIDAVLKKIKNDGFPFYSFQTGSRGFHIHLFFKTSLSNNQKLALIKRYEGDEQKAYNGTTIALEFCPHWKTGKMKEIYKKWMK